MASQYPSKRTHLVRPWRQERSAATVGRITSAMVHLLATRDFESISVEEIVRLARTSKGAFYFRFDSKAHLLRYLAEATFEELTERSRAFFRADRHRALPLEPFLNAFIDHVAAIYLGKRNLLRAFLREARPGGDKVIAALVRTGSAESAGMLAEALRERQHEIRHRAPRVAIPMAVMLLGVMLRQAFLFPEQGSIALGPAQKQFKSELRDSVWGYLNQCRPRPRR